MVTAILIVSLSICVILLSREIIKLQKRVDVLNKETNTRISVTDQQTHLRINDEITHLLDIIKQNADNTDTAREEGLKELEKKIKSLIPPTNDDVMKRMDKLEKDSYTYRMSH
jgi:translation elongation factor EF-Tu-like GTPase